MRVLVAGGSGVLGRQLVPTLISYGHHVSGLVRSKAGAAVVAAAGGDVVLSDALDRDDLRRAVRAAAPDAVVHMLTAIPPAINPRRMARDFAVTNRLRTEGTRNLLAAAADAGVGRVISQGLAWAYDPDGAELADEDAPFWSDPPKQFAPNLAALEELERRTQDAGGLVLRLGHLYGPGSIYAVDGSFTSQVRAGKMPLVGGGTSVFSFTHAHDAATATAVALESDVRGALNIVDDAPAPMSTWLPFFADVVGAPAPKRVPAGLARMAAGSWGVAYLTRLRGADNSRAKELLDWRPAYPTWRNGFAAELKRVHPARRSA